MNRNKVDVSHRQERIELYLKRMIILLGLIHVFSSVYRLTGHSSILLVRGIDYAISTGVLVLLVLWIGMSLRNGSMKECLLDKIRCYFCKEQIFLLCIVIWSVISVVVLMNGKSDDWLDENLVYLYDLLICSLVLFPMGRYYSSRGFSSFVKKVLIILYFIASSAMLWILINVFLGNEIHTESGALIGIDKNYQLVIFVHQNIVGLYAIILIMIGIVGMIVYKGWKKIPFGVATIIFSVTLILTNSRSSILSLSIVLSILAGLVFYRRVQHIKLIYRWIGTLLLGMITFFCIQVVRSGFMSMFDAITNYSTKFEIDTESTIRELEPTFLNFRDYIWKCSFKSIVLDLKHFIVGVSPAGVIDSLSSLSKGVLSISYTHNQFLEVAVAVGVPGVCIFSVWLFFVARSSITIGLGDNKRVLLERKIIPLIILGLVINNLVEARLLYHGYFCGSVFFFLAGWVSVDGKTGSV